MKYLVFALLLLFPLGQLGRLNFQGQVVQVNDIAVLVVVLIWLCLKRGLLPKSPLTKPLLVWFMLMAASLAVNISNFSTSELLGSSLYIFRFILYAGLFFVVSDLKTERQNILKLLQVAVLAVALAGILQFIFLPDVSFLKAYDWDDHYYRAVSTFLDPGFTGAILVLGLILNILERSRIRTLIIYLALALTYSRASYLMYLVSFAALSFYKKSAKTILIAALVLLITIPLLPKSNGEGTKLGREVSIFARLNNWQATIGVWTTAPFLGIGFNTYRYYTHIPAESHSGGADNSLLLVLATTGTLGAAAYLYLLKRIWDLGDTLFKVSLVGVLVHSCFNNTLFYPWVMEWLWILLALRTNKK